MLGTAAAEQHNETINETEMTNQTEVINETEQLPEEANIRVPGDRFYAFTSISERIERGVASAPVIGSLDRQAQVEANHAEKRLAESEVLSQRGDNERSQQAIERYSQGIERATERANHSGNEEVQQRISEASERQEERLQSLRERLPEEAHQGIDRAIENSQRAANRAGGPPEHAGPNNNGQGPSSEIDQEQGQSNNTTEEVNETEAGPTNETNNRNGERGPANNPQ